MNFFKSAKYKMGASSSKGKGETKSQNAEHFHKIDTPAALDNGKAKKGKAPPKPSDDDAFCFRISNKTSFPWKLKGADTKGVFPTEIPVNESQLIRLEKGQAATQATYTVEAVDKDGEAKACELQFKLACNENNYELIVDWMSLATLDGIQFKPDSTSSNQPIKLSKDEIVIEAEYKQ